MGSDNTFSELCPICGTEMNDNWIGEERILICPKCSFYKETISGMWSKCGKLDDIAIATGGEIKKVANPILLDGCDSKETVIEISNQTPTYMDAKRAELCMNACRNLTDEFLEMGGIEGLVESWGSLNGIRKEDATYMHKRIWRKENG